MKRIILTLLVALNILNLSADNTRYVNMFLGSAGDHGQLPPGATVPFGMVSVCPDSDPNQHGGYDYNVERISGIHLQLRQEPQGTSDFRLRSQGPCRLGTGESGLVLG